MADKLPKEVLIINERDHVMNFHFMDGGEQKTLTLGRSGDKGVEGEPQPEVTLDRETWGKLCESTPIEALFNAGAIRVFPVG